MSFDVKDGSDSTDVVTSSNVGQMSWLVGDPADNLVVLQIVLNGVMFVNVWVWESDGSGVVSDDVWDLVRTDGFSSNLAKLEVGFWTLDTDQSESSFLIIQKSETLSSLDDIEHIHNSHWEFGISSDFMINFESCLFILSDNGDLFTVSCQSETISEYKLGIT